MKIKLSKAEELFINMGTMINDPTYENINYYHLPFWFCSTDEEGIYEILFPNEIPKEIYNMNKEMEERTYGGNETIEQSS
jgi:hypothetical protein